MTPLRLSVSVDSDDPDVMQRCVASLFCLAATQTGASIADLESGDIAVSELMEALTERTRVTQVTLQGTTEGFEISFELAETLSMAAFDEGSRQIIDGGLPTWTLTDDAAVISLPFGKQPSDHE